MEQRLDLMRAEKAKIQAIIQQVGGELSPDTPLDIGESFFAAGYITMTPPEQEPERMDMILLDAPNRYRRGRSVKPGNIALNLRKLIASLSDLIESGVYMAGDLKVLKVCAALKVWSALNRVMSVEIDRPHAIVITALWENSDGRARISPDKGFACANALCASLSEPAFDRERYDQILQELRANGNLSLADGMIVLREVVHIRY